MFVENVMEVSIGIKCQNGKFEHKKLNVKTECLNIITECLNRFERHNGKLNVMTSYCNSTIASLNVITEIVDIIIKH